MPIRKLYRRRRPGLAAKKRMLFKRKRVGKAQNKSHFFVRSLDRIAVIGTGLGTITRNGGGANSIFFGTPVAAVSGVTGMYDVPFSVIARLDDTIGSGELTTLFDEYKIVGLTAKFQTTYTVAANTNQALPYIEFKRDVDDSSPPTISEMRQSGDVVTKYFSSSNVKVSMWARPRPSQVVYGNASQLSAYATGRTGTWVDCANPGVEHWAFKGIIRNWYLPSATNQSAITIDIQLAVATRGAQ